MPKQYKPEFKQQVVLCIRNGLPIPEVSKKYHVAQSTLYRWIKDLELTSGDFSVTDYNTLQRQHDRINRILQVIRLSHIIDEVPLQKRLSILARLHEQFEQYSVHELCEALNVARGTFYNYIFRKADRTQYLQEQ